MPDETSTATDKYVSGVEQLLGVVQELSLVRDLAGIMSIVRRVGRELAQADGATFVLRDGNFCHYADEDAIGPLWKGKRFPLETCISGWSMLNREAAVIGDIYADPRIPADAYRPTFVKSLAMVPIRKNAPIGAIGVYWAHHHVATQSELRLLQALADSTSIAMENVAMYSELEQRVRARTQALEALNKELEAFSYSVSHDLKAPLRAIKGFTAALVEDHGSQLPSAAQHYLERIQIAGSRMDSLIDDLLRLSRITRADLQRRPVDLSALTQSVIDELQRSEPARKVDVAIRADVRAQGDPELMRVALENLLGNAWKFTSHRPDSKVEFGCDESESQPVFYVRDNGAGFALKSARNLFAPFNRYHTAAEFPGTGIGLATVQRIIHRHGGRIWADSAPNSGATFFWTLP
jgi:signal transduction histidine kinase